MSATAKVLQFPSASSASSAVNDFVLTPPEMLPEKKTRKPAAPRKPPVSLTYPQLLALLELAFATCVRDGVLILVTYWHGLRASEAVNLTEADFEGGFLKVQRGKGSNLTLQALQEHENPLLNEKKWVEFWLANRAQFGVKGAAKRGSPRRHGDTETPGAKTLQSRQIVKFPPEKLPPGDIWAWPPAEKPAGGPLTLPSSLKSLSGRLVSGEGHPEAAPSSQLLARSQKLEADRLFPISRVRFWQLVHGYALAVGIPARKCKTHMLKHTIAKHLIRNGVAISVVQRWLGWKSLATANWYMMEDEDECGDLVGTALRGIAGFRSQQQGTLF